MTDTITYVPLSSLRESPFNPRKTYPAQAMQELADSIASQGVMQPIVARPLPMGKKDVTFTYEIVFGHRRFRAATMAKLEFVPIIAKEMDDREAAVKQMHENIQRENPSAIDEADGFMHLHAVHKMKPDDIAKGVGKSRSYVYGRIKLAKAAPEIRQATSELGLSPESALELARLAHHDMQRAGMKMLRENHQETPERPIVWCSVREASNRLKNAFSTDLDDAPFPLDDATIAKRSGACTTCPRRAGNDPDLSSVLAATICTDRPCYEIKVKEWGRLELERFTSEGHRVVQGEDAKMLRPHRWMSPHGLVSMEDVAFEQHGLGPEPIDIDWHIALTHLGSDAELPKRTIIVDPGTGLVDHYITLEQANAILEALGKRVPGREAGSTPPLAARAAALARLDAEPDLRSPEEKAVDTWDRWERVQKVIMERAVARKERTGAELRMVARALLQDRDTLPEDVIEAMGWKAEFDAAYESDDSANEEELALAKLPTMSRDDIGKLLVLLAISAAPARYGAPGIVEKLEIAGEYDVDVVAVAGPEEQDDDADEVGGSTGQVDAFEGAEA